jgi:metal-responsive CopG/Arc/MetJ family transcriptional regulator
MLYETHSMIRGHQVADIDQSAQQRQLTAIRLPPDLLRRLDEFRSTQPFSPSRTRVIEAAIRGFLDYEQYTKTPPTKSAS